jgi:hypothetical protein
VILVIPTVVSEAGADVAAIVGGCLGTLIVIALSVVVVLLFVQ